MSAAIMNLRCGWDALIAEHNASCRRAHPVKDLGPECIDRFRELLSNIAYRDWAVRVHYRDSLVQMQICTTMPDTETSVPMENNSRLLPLCPEMSDGFVIDLAFELIKEFELHEAAERFRVNGVRLYYPHDPSGQPLREVRSMRSSPPFRLSTPH
jgi:hypothetical protein